MPRGSIQLTEARKKEIIDACSELYRRKSFKEIKLQDIADATTLTRTALYKYYQTKEEIFLGLLQREYEQWNMSLQSIINCYEELQAEELAEKISRTLEDRVQLLRLMSMNNFELEEQSRYERVVEYKRALGRSMQIMRNILDKFCSYMNAEKKEKFIYIFFPFTFGLYPYAVLNDKAVSAMDEAEIDFHYYSIYELSYNCLADLLKK